MPLRLGGGSIADIRADLIFEASAKAAQAIGKVQQMEMSKKAK